jgi:DNA invertase Pin-like site-specific DNA recombinase
MTDIGYARVSTVEQNLQLQLDALHRAGCDVIREEKVSGKAGAERPVQTAILRELRGGDTLTVWKLDRLGRSARDLEGIVANLQSRGVKFRALTQGIDTSSSTGWFFFQMLAAFAELERNMIIERSVAGKAARIAAGQHPGGPRTYGFDEDRTTVIEEEAARLREAADAALAGCGLAQLVDRWNEEGVPTKGGDGAWHRTTLRRMLTNPDLVPAILDQQTHDALVRLFAPAHARQQLGAPAKHLLSGILRCQCGAPMYPLMVRDRDGSKHEIYRCRRDSGSRPSGCGSVSIRSDTIEEWVTEAIVAAVTGQRFTDALNARRAALLEGEATSEELDAWQAEIADLQTVLSTRFGTEQHQQRHDELQAKVRRAQLRLLARPELQELMDLPRTEAAFRAAWAGWSITERRKRIRLLLRTVTVKATGRGVRFSESRLVPDWKI